MTTDIRQEAEALAPLLVAWARGATAEWGAAVGDGCESCPLCRAVAKLHADDELADGVASGIATVAGALASVLAAVVPQQADGEADRAAAGSAATDDTGAA